jgi:hypothetical protein
MKPCAKPSRARRNPDPQTGFLCGWNLPGLLPHPGTLFSSALRRLRVLGVLLIALFTPEPAFAAKSPQFTDDELQAVYLTQFGKFVEWPTNKTSLTNAPFVIGVLGNKGVAEELDKLAPKLKVNGRAINIRRLAPNADFSQCHILYIGRDADYAPILANLKPAGILLVGEHDRFAYRGGMINFVLDQGTVKFQANPRVATKAGLEIKSPLLDVVREWKMIINTEPQKGSR